MAPKMLQSFSLSTNSQKALSFVCQMTHDFFNVLSLLFGWQSSKFVIENLAVYHISFAWRKKLPALNLKIKSYFFLAQTHFWIVLTTNSNIIRQICSL